MLDVRIMTGTFLPSQQFAVVHRFINQATSYLIVEPQHSGPPVGGNLLVSEIEIPPGIPRVISNAQVKLCYVIIGEF